MDTEQFWTLIEDARRQVPDPSDGDAVAIRVSTLLAARTQSEIVRTKQVLWDLMAASYAHPLWAAAHVFNGGFDYVCGCLITQGREDADRVVAALDELATLTGIQHAADDRIELGCEGAPAIVSSAHLAATG